MSSNPGSSGSGAVVAHVNFYRQLEEAKALPSISILCGQYDPERVAESLQKAILDWKARYEAEGLPGQDQAVESTT